MEAAEVYVCKFGGKSGQIHAIVGREIRPASPRRIEVRKDLEEERRRMDF